MWRALMMVVAALFGVLVISACDTLGSVGGVPGGFGATPGGVQDLGLARELVKNGKVPPKDAFLVEAMFSEHDLPLTGPVCARVLCVRAGLGWAPTPDGQDAGWLQVGFSSTIDPTAFKRAPLDAVFVIDISGSMDAQYKTNTNEYVTPLNVAKSLARGLINQLDQGDRLGIVVFGSEAKVLKNLTAVTDKNALLAVIDGLRTEGATNMEAGLKSGFELIGSSNPGTERRVMLFTDANPNVGASTPSAFEQLAADNAKRNIGLTAFTFGVGIEQSVSNAMSHLRGGNAFSAFSTSDTENLIKDNWPWLASPIAFDLSLKLEPLAGFSIAKGYGFPEGSEGLSVSSIFLSKRRGAILVRFSPPPTMQPGSGLPFFKVSGTLKYKTPQGEDVSEPLSVSGEGQQPNAKGQYFAQPSTAKAVALALLVTGMREAAEQYANNREAATTKLNQAIERFKADAQALNDPTLQPEVDFGGKLLELMKANAPQGNLYGQ